MTGTASVLPGRILVVDDTESNRYVLATWLRRAGHTVREARTGGEALAVFDGESVDLVVLDVNLPDLSGFDVCEAIKAKHPDVPVLHVSATAVQPTDRSEGLRRGADGYLTEPVAREELIATVEALLRGADAQRTAVRLARRLRLLNEATLALYEAATLSALAERIGAGAGTLFDASAVVALSVDGIAMRVVVAPNREPVREDCDPEAVDALLAAVADGAAIAPFAGAHDYRSASLCDIEGQRGAIVVGDASPGSEEGEIVLEQYARAASVALKNARTYDTERRVALTLQRSLLPDAVPDLPQLRIAARYEASAQHAEVGGDFYDVFVLDQDRIAFAIGDVVGHSLEAAAVMAQLRTAIRSYLIEGHGPAATLQRLNRLLCRFHPNVTATACCGIYRVNSRRCELANAGHLPPLVCDATGAHYLPLGGPLLGIEAATEPALTFTLDPGALLVLFTDGLVERRNRSIDDGLAVLADVVAGESSDVDELCDRILRVVGPTNAADDIALVAMRVL